MKGVGVILKRPHAASLALAAFSVGLALAAPALLAADSDSGDSDPSGARAVRLSSVEGRVQVIQGDQVLADPAVANTPLFEGTQIVTMDDGRAEVEFEEGSIARLSPNSSFTLSVLKPDDGVSGTEITMDSGLGYFELQAGAQPGHIQVRFGDSVVTSSGYTILRINLDNPPGELAVFSGNAHLDRGGAVSLDLHGGESVALNAENPGQYNLSESIEPDSWDTWNSDRDQALNGEASSRTAATNSFANSANPAWSDLDANGNWYDVPGQGYVWSPYDASTPDWDPYGNGNWMWTPQYGYMWISGDSWGYMPFNCGMWNYYGGFGWGWAPGAGACNPWWGGGGFYPIFIGFGPPGYLPPRLPHRPPPRAPIHPGRRKGPYPLIAVNKRPASGFGSSSALHAHNVSATINGHVVMPLHPLSPRPQYDHTSTAFANRGSQQQTGSGYRPGSAPVYGVEHPPSIATPRPTVVTPRPFAPAPRAPAPAPARAPAPPPPPPPAHVGGGSVHH